MRNDNDLKLINFKVNLHHQRFVFINEHNVRGSNLKKKKIWTSNLMFIYKKKKKVSENEILLRNYNYFALQ